MPLARARAGKNAEIIAGKIGMPEMLRVLLVKGNVAQMGIYATFLAMSRPTTLLEARV
jgi:hypothetical protein